MGSHWHLAQAASHELRVTKKSHFLSPGCAIGMRGAQSDSRAIGGDA